MSSPHITYPPELPVSAAKDEIADAIRNHQVVIVAGATGSGKTTQLPKICWELGRTKIAHTQPRRLAARTIAERISEELGVELGTSVGYKVRFTDKVSDDTVIALMTDGILLNEIHRDRLLRRYDTIIIDEAHERSLNVDFLMGYLVRILPERPDLKIIITSATIDPQSFARHFSIGGVPAPVIEVSGRTFPVEIRYHEPSDDGDEVDAIVAALRELDAEPRGDVLVFLPGEAEIRDAMDALRGEFTSTTSRTEVLPLFGRLSAADQHRVFERSSVAGLHRRIILATNVAETSLTVPGIKYVVDTGTARISRYSVRSKVQRLPIEPISQASAQQRAGRAGRTSDGIAIRLFAEEDFDKRLAYTEPEILRTNLASVVLQMLALGFGDIEDFPFLTPPDSRGVKAALDLLGELGAVKSDGKRLTVIGTQLARLPIEPRFARMLIEAGRTGVSREVIAIVAGMTIQDVRERPEERREEADRLHSRFTDPTSDFLSLYALWMYLETKRDELGSSAFRRMCRDEMLNYVRVREWFDVHRQLERLMKDATRGERDHKSKNVARKPKAAVVARASSDDRSGAGSLVTGAADPDAVHRAILAGLLSQIGVLDTRNAAPARTAKPVRPVSTYLGSRGVRFAIFPGSGLRKKAPAAVMAGELVETSRLYARSVAAIDTAWAESLAGDLAHRSISEPHWSKASGAALAYEKVTLFGVEIVAKRRIHFSRIDPAGARELFVRHALVEGEWDTTRLAQNLTAFVRQNHELRKRLEKQEERERRRDILVGDEAVFDFYNSRIPHDVADVRTFEAWWKATIAHTPKLLTMRAEDLLEGSARAGAHEFPSHWAQGDLTLALAYRFEPGAKDDGVTVVIPLPLLASVEAAGFDWQVPGMRDELITAILRSFPKAIRRHVVPAADWATKFATALSASGPEHHGGRTPATLGEELARLIQPIANQRVSAADIEWDRVASHVRINYRAVDTRGRAVDSDRDLSVLQARLSTQARASVADQIQRARPAASEAGAPASRFTERTGITTWDLGTLPAHVDTALAGGTVRGYPGLVDDKTSVSVRVQTDPAVAERLHHAGVRRLLLLNLPSPASYVQDHLTSAEKLSLATSPYPSVKALIEDARAAVIDQVIASSTTGPIRTEADFIAVRDLASAAMVDATFQAVSLAARILDGHRAAERIMKKVTAMPLLGALADVRGQLAGLVYSGFISSTGLARLAHFPRYLAAIAHRLENLPSNAGRDRAWMTEWERADKLFTDAKGTVPVEADARAGVINARWLLEELRVSLYAQQLGTAEAVSIQRISKALAS